MFEFIRQHRKLLQVVLLLLIIPSFVAVGAWDLVSRGEGATARLADVDGVSIDRAAWERAHQNSIDRMSAQFGRQVPVALLDTPAARLSTLNQMITDEVLKNVAHRYGLRPSDSLLRSRIAQIPDFQVEGVFNLERAKQVLQSSGYTAERFEVMLRQDLASELFPRAVSESALASRRLARLISQSETEQRVFAVKRFESRSFEAQVRVSDEQVKASYEANPSRFQSTEAVDIELVVLRSTSAADVETFTNLAYEQSDSLEPAAVRFKLPILKLARVERGRGATAPAGASEETLSILRNPKLREALFSAEVLTDRRNTPAIEVRAGVWVSARVSQHHPAQTLAFDQVRQNVLAEVTRTEAARLALEASQAWLASAQSGEGLRGLETVRVARADIQGAAAALRLPQGDLGRRALEKIFSDAKPLEKAQVIDLGEVGRLGVVLLSTRVDAPEAAVVGQRLGGGFNMLTQSDADLGMRLWMREQERRLKVRRYTDKLAAASS